MRDTDDDNRLGRGPAVSLSQKFSAQCYTGRSAPEIPPGRKRKASPRRWEFAIVGPRCGFICMLCSSPNLTGFEGNGSLLYLFPHHSEWNWLYYIYISWHCISSYPLRLEARSLWAERCVWACFLLPPWAQHSQSRMVRMTMKFFDPTLGMIHTNKTRRIDSTCF